MQTTDLNLSLRGDTFSAMKSDFDDILGRTIGNMEMKGANVAVVTIKLDIELEKTGRNTPSGYADVVVPKFKHNISSVMQVKDKVSGQLSGDYQLVWDEETKKYVMREIDIGQESLFDGEAGDSGAVDADYRIVPDDGVLPENKDAMALPEHDEPADELEEDSGEEHPSAKDVLDETTPFGWLAKFINQDMRVTEAMGNFTVRTGANRIVLSSATSPDSPFFCGAAMLAGHIGHRLVCKAYGGEIPAVITIECADCGETVFFLAAPNATEEEVREAMNAGGGTEDSGDDEFPEDDEPGDDYQYDAPEE